MSYELKGYFHLLMEMETVEKRRKGVREYSSHAHHKSNSEHTIGLPV